MSSCGDCHRPLLWRVIRDKNVPLDPDGQDHRLICPGEYWSHWRLRQGLVPGQVPMSITRIADYRACPNLYYRKYILREPRRDSPEADFGRQFHAYAAGRLKALYWGAASDPRPRAPSPEWSQEWHS